MSISDFLFDFIMDLSVLLIGLLSFFPADINVFKSRTVCMWRYTVYVCVLLLVSILEICGTVFMSDF